MRFFVDQLGFDLVADYRYGAGERWVAVAPPDGSAVLALVAPKPGSEEWDLIGRSKQIVFVTEDVPTKYDEWRKQRVQFRHPPITPAWGGTFTTFEDIDGNSFVLVGFDEMSREIESQRQVIGEKLESERRAAQELEIAKEVQAGLFPRTLPAMKTLDYAGVCIQAREVGGDYYDFLALGEDRLGLVVGDIAGKGIAAALLMANLQATLRSQCATALDEPLHIFHIVNQLFCENTTDSKYATLFFAEYDGELQRLRYINCGHLSGLLLRQDGTLERLGSTCTVLGLFKEWAYSTEERPLCQGDVFAIYSDGITECFNEAGEEFGEHRLVESLRKHREEPSSVLLSAIVDDVRAFSYRQQSDDMTFVVAKCK
jgi:serine phosphatase RsbU (regulator of sigma subunit)